MTAVFEAISFGDVFSLIEYGAYDVLIAAPY